jgi:hypothetical protein
MIFQDAPLLQLYLAVTLQVIGLAISIIYQPFTSLRRNIEEFFFTGLTIVLMTSCIIYTIEEASDSQKDQEEDFFIYSFMAMMGVVFLMLMYDLIKSIV